MHTVLEVDLQTHHDKSYVVNRKWSGKNVWCVLCFANDCIVMTKHGLREAHAGDCFIKSPEFIEFHYTPEWAEEGFINDWMHVRSDTLRELLDRLRLPADTIIETRHAELLRGDIQKIMNEKRDCLPFSADAIHNRVEAIFLKIARAAERSKFDGNSQYDEKLLTLRTELQKRLAHPWSLQEMADLVGLSVSRLSVLYKKRFALSPNQDLIHMRIEQSKLLLLSGNMKLEQISRLCGFKNEYYFSRLFKKRENISPGAYRQGGYRA